MSDTITPNYASENLVAGTTYTLIGGWTDFGKTGAVITILDINDPNKASSYSLEERVNITFFSTSTGLRTTSFQKFGPIDYMLMSQLKTL